MQRRDFLKNSALATTAAVVGTGAIAAANTGIYVKPVAELLSPIARPMVKKALCGE